MSHRITWSPSSRRLRGLLLVVLLTSIVFVATANAGTWSSTYFDNGPQWWGNGGIAVSGFNYGIGYNQASWDYNAMRTTLCNASYQCYDYWTEWDGFIQDYAYIGYGRAKCNGYAPGGGSIYVHHCYANNY